MRRALPALLLIAAPLRPQTAAYTGAKACDACHRSQFARQTASAHAAALFRTPDHPLAGSFPAGAKMKREPNYSFEFFRSGGELRTRISDVADVMDLPMEWAFGAGRQAV